MLALNTNQSTKLTHFCQFSVSESLSENLQHYFQNESERLPGLIDSLWPLVSLLRGENKFCINLRSKFGKMT
jgi:hypothetical protein